MVSCQAVQAMKAMASDPRKRAILVKDTTCIGGLVLVLSNPDETVVKLALETIQSISETPEYRPVLRNFIGMMDQLQCLGDLRASEVGRLAKALHTILLIDDQVTPLKDTFNTSSSNTGRRKSSLQKSLHGGLKLSKTIVLQMKGLVNKCDRDVCMRLLLQIKGVISITFDMNKKRCIVRTKPDVRPETLVIAVAKTQSIHAQQVIRSETGEELLLSFGQQPQQCDKENVSDLPDYLSEEEEVSIDEKAIARNKPESKAGGWLSSAASFLTNSFYW